MYKQKFWWKIIGYSKLDLKKCVSDKVEPDYGKLYITMHVYFRAQWWIDAYIYKTISYKWRIEILECNTLIYLGSLVPTTVCINVP